MNPGQRSIRRIRTYADDLRRAKGETVAESVPEKNTPQERTPSLQSRVPLTATPHRSMIPQGRVVSNAPEPAHIREDHFDVNTAISGDAPATILREQRGEGWSFGDALRDAISGWFKTTRSKFAPPTREAPRVAPAAERARIIKAAVTQSSFAPQDDHDILVERLKTLRPDTAPSVEPAIPTQPEEGQPSWSHFTDTTKRADVPEPLPPPPILRPAENVPPPTLRSTLRPIKDAPLPRPRPDTQPANEASYEIIHAQESMLPQQEHTVVEQRTELQTPSDVPTEQPTKTFTDLARERALLQRRAEADAPREPFHLPPLLIYIGMFAVVVVAVGGIGIVGYRSIVDTPTPVEQTPRRDILALPHITSRTPVALTADRASFMIALSRLRDETSGTLGERTEYFFVYPNDATVQQLPPEAFFDALEIRAPRSLIRTISGMVFGVEVGAVNQPFIVFRVRDRNEALGSMLDWERFMNQDLAPLFGEDQSLLGVNQLRFVDGAVGGSDARILRTTDGTTILAYTISGNYLIIGPTLDIIKNVTP